MDDIEIKSNRLCLVIPILIPTIFATIFWIFLIFVVCLDAWAAGEYPQSILIFGIFEMFLVAFVLMVAFYKRTCFKFTDASITVHKTKKINEVINIEDIQSIHYYKFKLHYLITIFAGALNDGGCCQLHILMKNGEKRKIGFFVLKNVEKLKTKYGDLITIQ